MYFISNIFRALLRTRSLPVALVASLLVSMVPGTPPQAQQAEPFPWQPRTHLEFPVHSPGIPAYARLELLVPNFDLPNNRRWAAIVFYRDPACVPTDFNLGQFFHYPGPDGPGAFACPLLVEGHEIWENRPGPGGDPAPLFVRTRNAVPNMPIWFVAWDELRPILETGQVFIGDITSLPSLIRGSASRYDEALYPNETAEVPGITLSSEGTLEGGGRFRLRWHFTNQGAEDEVTIRLWRYPRYFR